MRPAARISAAMEILAKVEDKTSNIDHFLATYFRQRRYAGSKDRHEIRERVYRIVRNRFKLEWWIEEVLEEKQTSRLLILSDIAFFQVLDLLELDQLFDGSKNQPETLNENEKKIYQILAGEKILNSGMPRHVRCECPDWILRKLEPVFMDELERCMGALNEEAPLDLRINSMKKTTREQSQKLLRKFGIETEKTQYSPIGLRVRTRKRIDQIPPFRNGLLEIQDEGAQITAMLVDAQPGMQVADFCSGAGGKTLAIGAHMENKGRVLALDTSSARLDKAAPRIKRAGLDNVERRQISDEFDPKLKRLAKKFDRVLVDAPCSGIGTWRRDPDTRRRFNQADLEKMVQLQQSILTSAARLVAPKGRLIYVTCSLIPDENEEQVLNLLKKRDDFSAVSIQDIWSKMSPEMANWDGIVDGHMMRLTPHQYGTDGFFISILERSS